MKHLTEDEIKILLPMVKSQMVGGGNRRGRGEIRSSFKLTHSKEEVDRILAGLVGRSLIDTDLTHGENTYWIKDRHMYQELHKSLKWRIWRKSAKQWCWNQFKAGLVLTIKDGWKMLIAAAFGYFIREYLPFH